jgi:hypothetical protein
VASITSFLDLTVPYLPGAEAGVIRLHARRVLREFLKRTTVWRSDVTFQTLPNVEGYRITMPTGQDVATILNAWRIDDAGNPKPLGTINEAQRAFPRAAGQIKGWYFFLPQVVNFWPQPDMAYDVKVDIAVTLPIAYAGDDTFPDDVFATYGEDIAAGIIGYMMAMPGKPWTQVQAGGGFVQRYENCIKTLRAKLRDGGAPNVSTAHGPRIV